MTLVPVALTALLLAADPGFDTVFLQNGGRLRGTVVEESPTTGVTIQIPGGQLRSVPPGEVFRIEYHDGSVGLLGQIPPPPPPPSSAAPAEPAAAPSTAPSVAAEAGTTGATAAATVASDGGTSGGPPAPPTAAAPRRAAPPRPPPAPVRPDYSYPDVPPPVPPPGSWAPPRRHALAPGSLTPAPFMLAAGFGFMIPTGNAAAGYGMDQVVSTLGLIELEGGLRLTPAIMASLYLDLGLGEAGHTERAFCRSLGGTDCSAFSARGGLQLRYAFTPTAPATPWVAVGVGGEATSVSFSTTSTGNDLYYTGVEWRLGTGIDFRRPGGLGWGLFANAGFGRYDKFQDYDGSRPPLSQANHVWLQAGLRVLLGS